MAHDPPKGAPGAEDGVAHWADSFSARHQRKVPQGPGARSADFVDVEDPEVVSDWTRSLGITRLDLLNAVESVGPAAGNVYDYIRRWQQGAR